jgi:hypothetical protein
VGSGFVGSRKGKVVGIQSTEEKGRGRVNELTGGIRILSDKQQLPHGQGYPHCPVPTKAQGMPTGSKPKNANAGTDSSLCIRARIHWGIINRPKMDCFGPWRKDKEDEEEDGELGKISSRYTP